MRVPDARLISLRVGLLRPFWEGRGSQIQWERASGLIGIWKLREGQGSNLTAVDLLLCEPDSVSIHLCPLHRLQVSRASCSQTKADDEQAQEASPVEHCQLCGGEGHKRIELGPVGLGDEPVRPYKHTVITTPTFLVRLVVPFPSSPRVLEVWSKGQQWTLLASEEAPPHIAEESAPTVLGYGVGRAVGS